MSKIGKWLCAIVFIMFLVVSALSGYFGWELNHLITSVIAVALLIIIFLFTTPNKPPNE